MKIRLKKYIYFSSSALDFQIYVGTKILREPKTWHKPYTNLVKIFSQVALAKETYMLLNATNNAF